MQTRYNGAASTVAPHGRSGFVVLPLGAGKLSDRNEASETNAREVLDEAHRMTEALGRALNEIEALRSCRLTMRRCCKAALELGSTTAPAN